MADTFDGAVAHLRARDLTLICVSSAPIDRLAAYKRRMGGFEWVSAPEFNADFGFSQTEEAVQESIGPFLDQEPPIVAHIARASGTDPVRYVAQLFGFTSFAAEDGAVYHTYSTTGRGIEFLMGYYGILDRAPNGRRRQRVADLDPPPRLVRRFARGGMRSSPGSSRIAGSISAWLCGGSTGRRRRHPARLGAGNAGPQFAPRGCRRSASAVSRLRWPRA